MKKKTPGSFKKGSIPWNKGKKGYITSSSFKNEHPDLVSEESRLSAGEKHKGSLHHAWKGNQVGYNALHGWIKRNYGSPTKCEGCGFESKDNRKIHWANVSGKYFRDRSDWKRLCCKCHFVFDKHPHHVNK